MRTPFTRSFLPTVVVAAATFGLLAALTVSVSPPEAHAQESSADCTDGMAGPYECLRVDLESFLPLPIVGQGNGNDIWGWTDPETGQEYAIIGSSTATGFVDVTDPKNPVVVGQLPTAAPPDLPLWRDIKVIDNFAYIVSEISNHGMQVFDLTKLRDADGDPPTVFSEDALYRGGPEDESLGHAHNVVANPDTNFVYPVGSNTCVSGEGDAAENGGLHAVDVSDPLDPTFAGCALVPPPEDPEEEPNNNYVHDAQCVVYEGPDPDYQGDEICLGSNEDAVVIYNMSDKANPEIVSITTYDTAAYTHQGWLTHDQEHFLFGDEGDETSGAVDNTTTYIMDVRDLDAPRTPQPFFHETQAIDHNLYLSDVHVAESRADENDGYVFQSNYAAGLRILDFDDLSLADGELDEVAYFDMFPGDPTEFVGTWSNYAFFDSGTVVVSVIFDQKNGLFVLRPNLNEVSIADAEVAEGDSGTTEMTFDVSLSKPAEETIEVDFETSPGSAAPGSDFEPTSGTVTFEPAEEEDATAPTQQIAVEVHGDTQRERDETFTVTLSESEDALLADGEAVGTILDDDEPDNPVTGPESACDASFVPDAPFGDVTGNTHEAAIDCIAWYTITIGRGDTDGDGSDNYDPEMDVSRGQMASYLARLLIDGGIELPEDPEDAFEDDDDSVHHDNINALAELGIVQGVGDTDDDGNDEYDPRGSVTRAQMATFVARTHNAVTGSLPQDPPNAFDDDDDNRHHYSINALAELGIVQGTRDVDDADEDGDTDERLYFPERDVRRDQMATFMANDLRLFVQADEAFAGGAQVVLDEMITAAGDALPGRVRTNKTVAALTADGCGLTDDEVTVDAEGAFAVEIPQEQEPGDCTLDLEASTQRAGEDDTQQVTYSFEVTVTESGGS